MRLLTAGLLLAASLLMAQDPLDTRGWINRGVTQFKSGNYPAAVAAFQRAVESDPSNLVAHLYLGTAWLQQYIPGADSLPNRTAAAAANLEFLRVLELDRGNKTAMSSLASLDMNQKKWDDAQAWYEKLVAADPGNANAWYSMGFIAWSRWYPAYSAARQSLEMKPADPGPLTPGAAKEDLKTRFSTILESGLHDLQQSLLIDPQYDDAMAYMNLLIRERADLRDSGEEYQQDIAVANDWVNKAMAVKKAKSEQKGGAGNAPPPPPPPPPDKL